MAGGRNSYTQITLNRFIRRMCYNCDRQGFPKIQKENAHIKNFLNFE